MTDGKELVPPGKAGAARRVPLPIGTMTEWGVIAAVGYTGGERYYWMLDGNDTAMIPGSTVEQMHEAQSAPAQQGSDPLHPSSPTPSKETAP